MILRVILNNITHSQHRIVLKQYETDPFYDCTVIDFDQKTEIVTILSKDNSVPIMKEIPLWTIELTEFEIISFDSIQ
jgi:hypothetical protein